MANLIINGQKVTVDDSFLKLSPDQQAADVDEIAKQMGASGAAPAATAPQPGTPEYAAQFVARQATGQPQPQPAVAPPEWQPQDVMPAPLRAFSNHTVESVPVLGGLLHSATASPMNDALAQSADAQAPAAAIAGNVFGTMAPLIAGGGTALGGRLLGMTGSVASRVLAGAGSSAALGGADTLARGGSLQDAGTNALIDGTIGAALPGVGAGIKKALVRPATTTALDAVQSAKTAAYAAADKLGARYSPSGYRQMVNDLVGNAVGDNISADRHPIAVSMLKDLVQKPAGYSPTLTQLDQLRQVVRRDVANSTDDATAHFGQEMLNGIDRFIDTATPANMAAGSAPVAAAAIKAARAANQVFRKTETLDDVITKAQRQAASTGSGGNVNNALRQGVRRILDSRSKSAGFSATERAIMESIVKGSPVENGARLVGKLSPSGNGLMAALGLGATAANPFLALAPAAGLVAKHMADNATLGKIVALREMIAKGAGAGAGRVLPPPAILPPSAVPLLGNRPPVSPLAITVRGATPVEAQ